MNFDFNEDQKLLQKSARALLKDHCSLERVHAVMEAGEGIDRDLWKKAVEAGWTGVRIPEQFGGSGFGYFELVLLAEELGYAVAPLPFSSSVYLFTEAILLAGSDAQKAAYLPRLAKGELIGAFAYSEGGGQLLPGQMKTTFAKGKLSGTKIPVVDGMVAGAALVVARESGKDAPPCLVLADLGHKSITRRRVNGIDRTRHLAQLDFKETPAEVLCGGPKAADMLDRLLNRALVLTAFEQFGGSRRCVEMANAYAKVRYAFGRSIGSFQAVKHKIVDMFVRSELARVNCYYAAWALENENELPTAAAAARIAATDAFEFGGTENIQVHGGIGFTWEAHPHLLLKRSKLHALSLNGAAYWRDQLTQRLTERYKKRASKTAA